MKVFVDNTKNIYFTHVQRDPAVQYGKERPDVVFDPRLAPVLQVKAAEIIASDTYATNCTLR